MNNGWEQPGVQYYCCDGCQDMVRVERAIIKHIHVDNLTFELRFCTPACIRDWKFYHEADT